MEYVVALALVLAVGWFIYKEVSKEREHKGDGSGANPRDNNDPPRSKD